MTGLRRNTVRLEPHDPAWEDTARQTIHRLREILGGAARDIQHIGSTSIPHIMAKPIIDIAVAVNRLDDIDRFIPQLEQNGFIHRPVNDNEWQRFFACGDLAADTRDHHIHVVRYDGNEWRNYINFRGYLTRYPEEAAKYEEVKRALAARYPSDRDSYTDGKGEIIAYLLRKATVWSWLGKTAHILIDRPIGYIHRKSGYTLEYPINYGYIPGVPGGDGEELDVYLLGVDEPAEQFDCRIYGIVHRRNDVEDKLVAAPAGFTADDGEISAAVRFQEKYYDSVISRNFYPIL